MPERLVIDTSETTPKYLWVCANGTYLKLSPSAYHLFVCVEQGTSFATIAATLSARQGCHVPVDDVEAAYRRVAERIAEAEARDVRAVSGFWLRVPMVPARAVAALARVLAVLFNPLLAACLCVLALASCAFVLRHGLSLHYTPAQYWQGYGFFLLSLLIHEWGHASACARWGARPSDIGFATYWVYPVFYSDVSAAWQLRRWQRVVVDLGGAYFQAIAAGAFAIAYLVGGWVPLKVAVIMIVGSCVFMLNPILKFDGYWVVADALGVANLSQQPRRILRHVYARLRGRPSMGLPWSATITGVLAAYTVAAVAFWIYFVAHLAPLVWHQLLVYPTLLNRIVAAMIAPPHLPSLGLLNSLMASTFLLLVGWLMVRRVAQPLVKPAWAFAARWWHPDAAPATEGNAR